MYIHVQDLPNYCTLIYVFGLLCMCNLLLRNFSRLILNLYAPWAQNWK